MNRLAWSLFLTAAVFVGNSSHGQVTSGPAPGIGRPVARLTLNPQKVAELTLSSGLRARAAGLEAQRSYLQLEEALGVFDIEFKFNPSYEYSELQLLSGFSNLADRTARLTTSLAKKFRTGTLMSLTYEDARQNSTLSPFTANARAPNSNIAYFTFDFRQELLNNSFGYADRLAVEIANESLRNAMENRDEQLEVVLLDAMTLFWDAYKAEQELRDNIAARDKYDQLVKNVRRKSSFNLSSPGELPRMEAEFEATEQRVKSSSLSLLRTLDQLRATLQLDPDQEIALDVPKDLPPVPKLATKNIEELRVFRVAKKRREIAERELLRTRASTRPTLNLVAKSRATGQDQEVSRAQAKMTSGEYPVYYVGLEFVAPIDSSAVRGRRADAEIQLMQAEVNLKIDRDAIRNELANAERAVAAQYVIAKSSMDSVDHRERVVRQVEASYRQGRQPLVELIRAYNELFAAQLDRARAVSDYHINLNRLAATRDELTAYVK